MSSNPEPITIRIARRCVNTWVTQHENGTMWHGAGSYLLRELMRIIPAKLEFLHDFPPSNETNVIVKGKRY